MSRLTEGTRTAAAVIAVVAALLASPAPAQPLDFGALGQADTFEDLPGVTPPQKNAPKNTVSCVQKFVEPALGRSWRMERQTYYSCSEGSLTFESNRPPLSRERSMRGLGW